MFISIDGLPGAGKTYYLVDYIFNNKSKYHKVFTNINEFKFVDNINPLEFSTSVKAENTFLYHLEKLKDIYDSAGTTDKDLTEYLLKYDFIAIGDDGKYKPFLLGIDEAHNEFAKKNDLLLWFISYHRHLHVDCVLVTQDYSMYASCYYKLVEYYLHAVPSSRVIFGNKRFKYRKHIAVPYNDAKTKTDEIFLTKRKEVFDLYQSGDEVRSPNVIKKFFFMFVIAVSSMLGLAYFVINFFFSPDIEKPKKEEINNVVSSSVQNSIVVKSKLLNLKLIEFTCTIKRCTNKREEINFSFDLLQLLVDESESKIIKVERNFKNLSKITVLVSDDFLNFFPKGVSNEKRNSNNPINLF